MSVADPPAILAKAALWAADLQARGQVDDTAAARLNDMLDESRGERLDHQDDPLLVVMLCGPTAVGKSSLINALAGADISPPGLGATTRAAVLYVHEQDDPARLIECSPAFRGSEQPATQLVRHRRDELLHKVLVDTPDIDSIRLQHHELTARLVHAADLVLFVTSPEKYKVMRSARWILEQRQQRGLAFVLNKWDREALGRQRDRRREVEADFRQVLAGEGFPGALIFKVSALTEAFSDPGPGDIENELPTLRTWLEAGISQSTATMIRQRRLRAAWGRLAAAIDTVVPQPLSGHPFLPEAFECLDSQGGFAMRSVSADAAVLEPAGLEDSGWPATPGLLGMWTRLRHRVASGTASLRAGLSLFKPAPGGHQQSASGTAFGGKTVAVLAEAAGQLVSDAAAARLALGPVGAVWSTDIARLAHPLARLPLDVATELVAEAGRPTFRRLAGITSLYAVEGLIVLVLLVAVVRIGADFVVGSYAPTGLFVTVLELNLILVVLGHIVATVFFPPVRQRLRRAVAQRAGLLVEAVVERAQAALRDQVEAVDRLAREGRDLLLQIDLTLIALTADTGDGAGVDRLFGQPPPLKLIGEATGRPLPEEVAHEAPVRRRATFD
jgi:energy-coupling factor transporter ATP-binding protein EcfA2